MTEIACDSDATGAAVSRAWVSGRRARVLLCGAGASFLIMLDTNVVAISLPSIARDLHVGFTSVEWVVSAYILAFAALLMPAGALADRLGRRRMLICGLATFSTGSLLCGLSSGIEMLMAARVLQGVGAAFQLSAALAVLGHEFRGHERARAFAFWGSLSGLAVVIGPVVGGGVATFIGWRWVFLVNEVPVGAALIVLALTSVRESRDPHARRLDLPGIVLFGTGLFSMVWALIGANHAGWGSISTLAKLAVGVALLVVFIVAERAQRRPMVDLSLFRRSTVVGAAVAMLGFAASAQVMLTFLPLCLQDMFGASPMLAGLEMVPFAVLMFLCPRLAGILATRLSGRALLGIGLGVVAAGDGLIAAAIQSGQAYWIVAVGMAITGSGAGLLNGETTKVQISVVPTDRAGMASGITGTTRFVGLVSGVAGLGAVLAAAATQNLKALAQPWTAGRFYDWHHLILKLVGGDAGAALSMIPADLRERMADAMQASMSLGFAITFVAAALVAIICGILTFLLIRAAETAPTQPK